MSTTLRLGGKGATRLDLPVIPHAERPVPVFLPPAEDPVLAGFGALESGTSSGYGEVNLVERFPLTRRLLENTSLVRSPVRKRGTVALNRAAG